MNLKIFLSFILMTTLFARPWHESEEMSILSKEKFNYNIFELPMNGRSAKKIWTGEWYPNKKNGTAHGALSPLKKLEKVSGYSNGAVQWEKNFAKTEKKVSWSGHCNGLAVAGILYPEPKKNVKYRGVTFTAQDMKALLIEAHQGEMPVVGNTCPKKLKGLFANFTKEQKKQFCFDLNPAIYHIALTNYLGLQNKAVIIDRDSTEAVWNYPVSKYEYEMVEVSLGEAINLVRGNKDEYRLNHKADRFFAIRNFSDVVGNDTFRYNYILETDANGEIIGGEWVGSSKKNHPDFLWIPQENFVLENPFIDTRVVREIAPMSFDLKDLPGKPKELTNEIKNILMPPSLE